MISYAEEQKSDATERPHNKQVPFFPHPEGAETAASRLVAVIMTPLFKAQAAWDELGSRRRNRDSRRSNGDHRPTPNSSIGSGSDTVVVDKSKIS